MSSIKNKQRDRRNQNKQQRLDAQNVAVSSGNELPATDPMIQSTDSVPNDNPVASFTHMSITVPTRRWIQIPEPVPYLERYSFAGVIGQTHANNQPVTVLSETCYLELLHAKQQLDEFKNVVSENQAYRSKIEELEEEIEELIEMNEVLKADNETLKAENITLRKRVDDLNIEMHRLMTANTTLTNRVDKLESDNQSLKNEKRLQELKFISAEVVYEVQRLLIRRLWPDLVDDDAADVHVDDLNKKILFARDTNTDEFRHWTAITAELKIPDNSTIGSALKAFKSERLAAAHWNWQDETRTLDEHEADLIEYCELDAKLSRSTGVFAQRVNSLKMTYIARAKTVITVAKQLIPAEREGCLFNKFLSTAQEFRN